MRSFRANPPHGIDTQTRRRQSCAHEGWPHAPRTIGDDVDAVWGEAGPQHRVLLAGVGDADGLMHVGKHALEQLVHEDAGRVGEAKQRMVREHNLAQAMGDRGQVGGLTGRGP